MRGKHLKCSSVNTALDEGKGGSGMEVHSSGDLENIHLL